MLGSPRGTDVGSGPDGCDVITRDEVMPLLLTACPSFARTWAAELEHDPVHGDEDGTRLHYLDASTFAAHLVGLLRAGAEDEVRAAFAVLERLHVEGDPYVRELATIGYLEHVEGELAGHPEELASVESLLGPESARWWRGVQAFWTGRAPYVRATD